MNHLGELMWIARATRPDILFAMSLWLDLIKRMIRHTGVIFKRIAKVFLSTVELSLILRDVSDQVHVKIAAHVDADSANDPVERN
jgi:hypothetical protein